jgi:hypothetical protein
VYLMALTLHSWIRWVALLLGIVALVRALSGRRLAEDRSGFFFVMAMDVQLLLGLILYVALSPFTTAALQDLGTAMRTPALRFWAVEHSTLMLVSVVVAHLGRAAARRAAPGSRRPALFYALSLLAMLVAIPWPGFSNGRPLLRIGG